MKGLLLLSISWFSLVFSQDCKISQTHITLGDHFSLEGVSDHAFTVGLVAVNCSGPLQLGLMSSTRALLKMIPASSFKPIETSMPDNSTYTRNGVFFYLSLEDCKSAFSWTIYYNDYLIYGPVKLARKVLMRDEEFKMAVIADMDLTQYSTDTIKRMNEWATDQFDCFMHIGDFAYEIEDDGGSKGDQFFSAMSSTTNQIPYIVTPGNHESYANGSLFNYRFRMPNTVVLSEDLRQNHHYDFVVKENFFITVNFDYIMFLRPEAFQSTLQWFSDRLTLASANPRLKWKVFFSHRPFYCNDLVETGDCSYNLYALHPFHELLLRHNISYVLNGHLHIYSRMKPFVNLKVMPFDTVGKGSYVAIINGHAGTEHGFPNSSSTDKFELPFVEKVDLTGPTYVHLNIQPKSFTGKLYLSKDNTILDQFGYKDHKPKQYPDWLVYLLISVGAFFCIFIVLIMIIQIRRLRKDAPDIEEIEDPMLKAPIKGNDKDAQSVSKILPRTKAQ